MKYKGYTGSVEQDANSKVLYGHVLGLEDIITYKGDSTIQLVKAFKDSINDYLKWCIERNEKPFKGTLIKKNVTRLAIDLPTEMHKELKSIATIDDTSMREFILDSITCKLLERRGKF